LRGMDATAEQSTRNGKRIRWERRVLGSGGHALLCKPLVRGSMHEAIGHPVKHHMEVAEKVRRLSCGHNMAHRSDYDLTKLLEISPGYWWLYARRC
jgi:hypothetical protein